MNFAYSLNDLICYDDNNNYIGSLGESNAVITNISVSKDFLEFKFEVDSLFLERIEALAVIHNNKVLEVEKGQQNPFGVSIKRIMNGNDEISIAAYTKHGKVMLQVTDTLKRKKEALAGNFILKKGKKKILIKREDSWIKRLNKLFKGFKNK